MRERFLPKNEHHLFDHIIDIEGHLLEVGLFRERADAPYYVTSSIAIHDDRPQGLAHFAQVGIFAVEKAQAGRGVEGPSRRAVGSLRARSRLLARFRRGQHV